MSQPFHRAMLMMAAIQAAMRLDGIGQTAALSNIGPYESRGKGKGRSKPSPRFGRNRSKYNPHIGAKEQAKWAQQYSI